ARNKLSRHINYLSTLNGTQNCVPF
ncbi:hypothetical protein D043_4958B, partial [Vibrio parahaemolyticus EKP-021]